MGVIQPLGYAMLTAPSHLVARTGKYEAVPPFPSKPSEHEQRSICLGRITGNKKHLRGNYVSYESIFSN